MAQVSQMGKKSKPISTTGFVHEHELSEQPALSEPQLQSSWRNSPHSTVDPFSHCRQAYSCRDFRAVKIPKIGRYHRKKESGWASCLLEEGYLVMVCLSAGSIVFTVEAREKCLSTRRGLGVSKCITRQVIPYTWYLCFRRKVCTLRVCMETKLKWQRLEAWGGRQVVGGRNGHHFVLLLRERYWHRAAKHTDSREAAAAGALAP